MKDDSGSSAVLHEQESSASQMTAAKMLDVIARLPGCAEQAGHAVSAYTQVKVEVANIFKFLLFLWEGIYSDTFLAGLLCERQFEKVLSENGWQKAPAWESLFVRRQRWIFLSVYGDDTKMAGKKQNLEPMRQRLMQQVDLEKPTQVLDQVYLGCTQRDCKLNKKLVDERTQMFESLTSAGTKENMPGSGESSEKIAALFYDMEGLSKKCVERYCDLANRNLEQIHKVYTPCIDDHQFKKKEELQTVGELPNVCSRMFLKCLYLSRIGRPDVRWSVNKLARPVRKWDTR